MMIPIKFGDINSTSLESRSWLWKIYLLFYTIVRTSYVVRLKSSFFLKSLLALSMKISLWLFQSLSYTGSSTTNWTKLNWYCVFFMQVRFCLKVVLRSWDKIILGTAISFCVFASPMKSEVWSEFAICSKKL